MSSINEPDFAPGQESEILAELEKQFSNSTFPEDAFAELERFMAETDTTFMRDIALRDRVTKNSGRLMWLDVSDEHVYYFLHLPVGRRNVLINVSRFGGASEPQYQVSVFDAVAGRYRRVPAIKHDEETFYDHLRWNYDTEAAPAA